MTTGLEKIAEKEYWGRLILIGKIDDNEVVAYAITGRSESSRARVLVPADELESYAIRTKPTDENVIKTGIKPLLIYNCFRHFRIGRKKEERALVVSNGGQTDVLIERWLNPPANATPAAFFELALWDPYLVEGNEKIPQIDLTSFEPDEPNYTPRISGVIKECEAGFHIIRKAGRIKDMQYFPVLLESGKARCIATYTGQNVPKGEVLPAFEGEPFEVELKGKTPEEIAVALYTALGPKTEGPGIISPNQDFRVGVAAVFYNRRADKMQEPFIINRVEHGE